MRLAYFSPLPPTPSGIADYSIELLPHLAERSDITLFNAKSEPIDESIRDRFDIRQLAEFAKQRADFDLALYHMGNNVYHEAIYPLALRYPGVVVLHDVLLHHFIGAITFVKGDFSSYVRELEYAVDFKEQNPYVNIKLGINKVPIFDIPLSDRLIDRSLGMIVHSKAAANVVQTRRPERLTRVIPHLLTQHKGTSLRDSLDVSNQTVIFASLGFINKTKQIELSLRQLARLRENNFDVHYLIVGGVQGEFDLQGLILELGIEANVTTIGYLDDLQTFIDWIETADIVLSLRFPTVGETSGVVLRAMGAGKPIIVFDHGWDAELPDDACIKVPPLDEQTLYAAMLRLAQDPIYRERLGERANHTARQIHDPGIVADAYIDFLESCVEYIRQRKLGHWG